MIVKDRNRVMTLRTKQKYCKDCRKETPHLEICDVCGTVSEVRKPIVKIEFNAIETFYIVWTQ